MSTPDNGQRRTSTNGHAPAKPQDVSQSGRVVTQLLSGTRPKSTGRKQAPTSSHSEESNKAVLQSGAGERAAAMAIDYSGTSVDWRLSFQGTAFFEGAWEAFVEVDGREIALMGVWESVCWNSDADADYLELQLQLDDELLINRQFVLARGGQVAIIADVVVAPNAKQLVYRGHWSFPSGTNSAPDAVTRAIRIRSQPGLARVYPLALPAERGHSSRGGLTSEAGELQLIQYQTGPTLYAPVVIDGDPRRRNAAANWRRLTVTEERRPVSDEAAAGYRLQVGADQWLVYHRLQDSNLARAVLGHHTWNETVVGEFRRDGSVRPYILVE
ncbi:MAG: hypothetical protein EXS05_06670 [Planctomycetaceae bacterium]|nr:hypothetical protein [Planctomycetaceae bacterium]